MSTTVLGIDTSNYTTSLSVACDGVVTENIKLPLPVKEGALGLRQSDAVFHHTKNLPTAFEMLKTDLRDISAIAVSTRPRGVDGSYMPCFLSGEGAGRMLSSALCLPLYRFSHQEGHLRAAIYSAGRDIYLHESFYGYHISGGTFELLKCQPKDDGFHAEVIGGTRDLTAGQAVDRTGVMLGIPFPCGREAEQYALQNKEPLPPVKIAVKGLDASLSGIENQTRKLYDEGKSKEFICAYLFRFLCLTIEKMTENLFKVHGDAPLLFSGGVTANGILRAYLQKRFSCDFAEPAFSADNAAGVALLGYDAYLKK